MLRYLISTCMGPFKVVGENLWVRRPLEVKGLGIREVGGVAGEEARTIHTINIIPQRQ
jgi:hypothetical protein